MFNPKRHKEEKNKHFRLRYSTWTIFCSLLFFITLSAKSQGLDSIFTTFNQKPHVFFSFDSHNSFISNRNANIVGAKTGLEFGNRLDIALGWYKLRAGFFKDFTETTNGYKQVFPASLRMHYVAYSTNYVYYQTRHWEFNINIQLGVGNTFYEYEFNGKRIIKNKKVIAIYEPVIGVKYLLLKWLGAEVDIGYRMILIKNSAIKENFTSPTYSFGGVFYIGEFYRSVVKPKLHQAQRN